MDRNDTKKILMGMEITYPNFKIKEENVSFAVDIWWDNLRDYPYEEVCQALKMYIATNTSGFAPSIGQIIDCIHKIRRPEGKDLNEMEAWNLVFNAIRNSAWHSQEEFDKLPPLVRKAVGSHNNLHAMAMDEEFNMGVEQSHFIKVYRQLLERERMEEKIPERIRLAMKEATALEDKGE